jgi:hypothetical protein
MDMTSAPANAGTNPSTRKPSPRATVIRLVSMSALAPFPGGDLQITEASASRNRIRSNRVARNGL